MYDFKTFTFSHGSHKTRDDGMCVMEAVAYVAGEAHTDHPACACPVLTAFLISWNDSLPNDEERQWLLSYFVFRIPGTKATPEIEAQRGMMALEWLIKIFTPTMLDLVPSLAENSKAIRGLKINKKNEAVILEVLSAAESAAWSVARSVAWSAAESAARSAARSAMLPTMTKLQRSAKRLLDRMIRLTEIKEKSAKARKEDIIVSDK